ncbi:TPA: ArsR family transcriptional regulator [Candidatus Bathyarchaeota archaeon]|nr:ArsR family transcriptional regulator [Candidatus Bathyarchaeota archaeon]
MAVKMGEDLGDLLYVLGNPTRRRILKLLSKEPKYLIQLSRELEISQQAILKHILVLERFGLISSYEERGELPAPPRKYYTLSRGFSITVDLTPRLADFEVWEVPAQPEVPSQLKHLRREMEKLEACKSLEEASEVCRQVLSRIDEEIRSIEELRVRLVCLKRYVAERFEDALKPRRKP